MNLTSSVRDTAHHRLVCLQDGQCLLPRLNPTLGPHLQVDVVKTMLRWLPADEMMMLLRSGIAMEVFAGFSLAATHVISCKRFWLETATVDGVAMFRLNMVFARFESRSVACARLVAVSVAVAAERFLGWILLRYTLQAPSLEYAAQEGRTCLPE